MIKEMLAEFKKIENVTLNSLYVYLIIREHVNELNNLLDTANIELNRQNIFLKQLEEKRPELEKYGLVSDEKYFDENKALDIADQKLLIKNINKSIGFLKKKIDIYQQLMAAIDKLPLTTYLHKGYLLREYHKILENEEKF